MRIIDIEHLQTVNYVRVMPRSRAVDRACLRACTHTRCHVSVLLSSVECAMDSLRQATGRSNPQYIVSKAARLG